MTNEQCLAIVASNIISGILANPANRLDGWMSERSETLTTYAMRKALDLFQEARAGAACIPPSEFGVFPG